MSTLEIPLSPRPQSLLVVLAGTQYKLTLTWCVPAAAWSLAVADSLGNPIVASIPLVCGIDLLDPFEYLEFGGRLYATTDHALDTPPTFDNLGLQGHLYFVED